MAGSSHYKSSSLYPLGKRLLGNLKYHFRDLCWVGALSGSGGMGAILVQNEESEKF